MIGPLVAVFLVAVSREEEMIGLQEARPDPHEPGE